MKEKRVIELFNLFPDRFYGRCDRGKIFSVKGVAPTIHTMGGGMLEPKIIKVRGKYLLRNLESGYVTVLT